MKQLSFSDIASQNETQSNNHPPIPKPQVENPSAPKDRPYTVSELNSLVRNQLEDSFKSVWLKGEVSNFTHHSSGHFYFSLKDQSAELRAVMFKSSTAKLKFKPQNGIELLVRGRVTLYPARGSTQIVCTHMEPAGHGALQMAFEQLKNKLQHEGLFDRAHPLPLLPHRIAIISSPTGAAIQDVLNVLKRRNPLVPIILIPSRVQGEQAVPDLLQAIERAHQLDDVDVLLVTRGGGSIEDLWCFNDERVARALANSPKVVVSAIGHEIDFTICDFVADRRAPTPSAAAEILVVERQALLQHIEALRERQHLRLQHALSLVQQLLHGWSARLHAHKPLRRVHDLMQRHDELAQRLKRSTVRCVNAHQQQLKLLQEALGERARQHLKSGQLSWQSFNARLGDLNPTRVLQRGFSVVTKGGRVLRDAEALKPADNIEVQLARGQFTAHVIRIVKA